MSSFVRTIHKTVRILQDENGDLVVKSRRGHYLGRGSKLGYKNPKDPCVVPSAKKKPKVWRARHKVDPAALKPRQMLGEPVRLTPFLSKAECRDAHRSRMLKKAQCRDANHRTASKAERVERLLGTPARINRNTGKPHKHTRERARRQGKSGQA